MSDDGQYMTAVAIKPNGRIYRSTDYGLNWAQVDDGIARDYAGVSMSSDDGVHRAQMSGVGSKVPVRRVSQLRLDLKVDRTKTMGFRTFTLGGLELGAFRTW